VPIVVLSTTANKRFFAENRIRTRALQAGQTFRSIRRSLKAAPERAKNCSTALTKLGTPNYDVRSRCKRKVLVRS